MQMNTRTRNARYLVDGRVDCEILHPAFGWVPFTADPNDVELHGRTIFAALSESAQPYTQPGTENHVTV